jgi:hypothetical protein
MAGVPDLLLGLLFIAAFVATRSAGEQPAGISGRDRGARAG